jgi:hypothetical protein
MSGIKKSKKDEKVSLGNYRDQFVTVYGTESNPYHATGEPIELHPDAAQHLINKGFATAEPDETEVEETPAAGKGAKA